MFVKTNFIMYYYLDTNAIYDLKAYPTSLIYRSFTSGFAIMEIVTGIIDEQNFKKRKGALNNLIQKKLTVKWDLPEKLLFESFELGDFEFNDERPHQLSELAKAVVNAADYEQFKKSTAYSSQYGFDFFKDLDDRLSKSFRKASEDGNRDFKDALKPDSEKNTVEIDGETFVLDSPKAVNDFFDKFPDLNRIITVYSLCALTNSWLPGKKNTDEQMMDLYNNSSAIFVDFLSKFSIAKQTSQNPPGRNDFADIAHLLYLKDYKNIQLISGDKIYKDYMPDIVSTILELWKKRSYLSQNHQGIQPIRVLQYNLTTAFEKTNPSFLQEVMRVINSAGLQSGINYYVFEESIWFSNTQFRSQTPHVDLVKKIALHETFLSYMWIICYSVWILYDETVAKPIQKLQQGENAPVIDFEAATSADLLLTYGRSLFDFYTEWNKETLPNPEKYSTGEAFYIERTNSLFLFAINFILCHEYAHVEKGHIDSLSSATIDDRKRFELEADARAIELVLKGRDGLNDTSIELGTLMGLGALLFFKKSTSGGLVHPDTDTRIKTYLETLQPPNTSPLWGIASLFFKLWDNQFKLQFTWPKAIFDFKELFYETLKQIEDRKNI